MDNLDNTQSSETLVQPSMNDDTATALMEQIAGQHNVPMTSDDAKMLQNIAEDPSAEMATQAQPPAQVMQSINPGVPAQNPNQAQDLQKILLMTQLQQQAQNPELIRQAQIAKNYNDMFARLGEAGQKIGAGMAEQGGVAIKAPDTTFYKDLREGFNPVGQLESQQSADAKRLQELATTYAKLNPKAGNNPLTISPILQTTDGKNILVDKQGNAFTKDDKTGLNIPYTGHIVNISNEVAKEGVVARNRMAATREEMVKQGTFDQKEKVAQSIMSSPEYQNFAGGTNAVARIDDVLNNPEGYKNSNKLAVVDALDHLTGSTPDQVAQIQSLKQRFLNAIGQQTEGSTLTSNQIGEIRNIATAVKTSSYRNMKSMLDQKASNLAEMGYDPKSAIPSAVKDFYNNYDSKYNPDTPNGNGVYNAANDTTTVTTRDGNKHIYKGNLLQK